MRTMYGICNATSMSGDIWSVGGLPLCNVSLEAYWIFMD